MDSLRNRFYPPLPDGTRSRDGTAAMYAWIRSAVDSESMIMNLGAGATTDAERGLRGTVARVVGADVDPAVLSNAGLDDAVVIDGVHLPFPDAFFDLVYSDWTMEHVASPAALLKEVYRVLRPGSSFVFRTPNLFHYVPLIAWSTPHRFHVFVAQHLRSSVPVEPWPTYYRVNTRRRARRMLLESGFRDVEIVSIEPEPSYLAFSPVTYCGGILWERLVTSGSALASLRHVMIARAER